MEKGTRSHLNPGVAYTFAAFLIWGFLTLYWKWLGAVPAGQILANRVVWSFVFMIGVLLFRKDLGHLIVSFKWLVHQPKQFFIVFSASVAISANWLIYVWAVAHNHVIEASLGLYIIPLVSMLIGIVFLREKAGFLEIMSILLAAAGVAIMTLKYGYVPWLALSLATTSGIYSLCKKFILFEANIGMTIETMLMVPAAGVYMLIIGSQTPIPFEIYSPSEGALLIGAGILTALPLIWFAEGAKRIPLTMIGFFQYITPSAAFLIGIFIFKEPIDPVQFLSFGFIWLSIIIYAFAEVRK
ncbi:EamA family transporter RarD [Sporolactobacillus putidus]|uniref:Transporter n=1 Tax=Sporolactobacillus putidus TaxID=492735 RepID=A0A917S4B5_9BACL|nr:EamA family transporter RarD [Sporolactobacillus putidus]GGL56844.1 transporter [Sporolactobacillus putidus]